MPPQIVLSCRMPRGGIGPGRPRGYLERARALTQRAEAHGATLAAWGALVVSFAWDTASAEEAVALAASLRDDATDATDAWAAAMSQGEMEILAPQGGGLAWGVALVSATALCRIARPGEVLVDPSVEALRTGELLRLGGRAGKDGDRTIHGARLDVRQPWKRDGAARVASLVDPPFRGRPGVVEALVRAPGVVNVIRAARGLGGSRLLAQVALATAPSPSLYVGPSGLGVEPLGALRVAFARKRTGLRLPRGLDQAFARLLAGEGIALDAAASLVAAALTSSEDRPSTLLIDDAAEVDGVTLEACAAAALRAPRPFLLVVRQDTPDPLHPSLAALRRGVEVELAPLAAEEGAKLAAAATGGALDAEACARWASRGACSPLGIVEAIACGLSTGDLAWVGSAAFARRRLVGKGRSRPAIFWLLRRAEELSAEARAVLSAIALLGGAATYEILDRVLGSVGATVDVPRVVDQLVASRWARARIGGANPVEGGADAVELLSRSHRDAVLEFIPEGRLPGWHRAVAHALSDSGPLARAEAAYHASRAADGVWAARLALEAAQAATECRLEGSALRLAAFASVEDPPLESTISVPVGELGADAMADSDRTIAVAAPILPSPDRVSRPSIASIPVPVPPSPPSRPASRSSSPRIRAEGRSAQATAKAREALSKRLAAIAALSQGQIAHAVVALRQAHDKLLDGRSSPSALCQASLVLAVALGHSGQVEEAMLQGLDALARAREGKDRPGEQACLTFLAKVFEGTARAPQAKRLRAKASAR